ncbi:MAG: hypothetical protein ACR2MP_11855, partial [Streptosporangiaceae bacterium]
MQRIAEPGWGVTNITFARPRTALPGRAARNRRVSLRRAGTAYRSQAEGSRAGLTHPPPVRL